MTRMMSTFLFVGTLLFGHVFICSSAIDCATVYEETGVLTFGPSCEYRCHCKNDVSCGKLNGECSGDCSSPWYGPGCQYRNLAKEVAGVRAKSQGGLSTPEMGIDDTIFTCASSNNVGSEQWYRLWWSYNVTITDMRIISLDQSLLQYWQGFTVWAAYYPPSELENDNFVPSEKRMCYKHSNETPSSIEIYVQCDPPFVGNHVKIEMDSIDGGRQQICDVIVNGGRELAYGKPVTASQSDDNNQYPAKNAVNGHDGSSNDELTSTNCYKSINTSSVKHFSLNLGQSMSVELIRIQTHNDDYLSNINILTTSETGVETQVLSGGGNATVQNVPVNDVIQRLKLEMIDTNHLAICSFELFGDCPPYKCGFDCSKDCYCTRFERIDNRIDGVCTGDCAHGRYGFPDCALKCSPNCFHGNCTKSGICIDGCIPGYMGDKCNIECASGTYGLGCAFNCTSKCFNCDFITGECYLCQPGWKGHSCGTGCNHGTYGMNCRATCGHCKPNSYCDTLSGKCHSGCIEGFTGDTCDDEETMEAHAQAVIGTSVTMGLLIVCVAGVAIAYIIYLRGRPPAVIYQPTKAVEGNQEEAFHEASAVPEVEDYKNMHESYYMG